MKPEINTRRKINHTLLNNKWVKEEIAREIRKYREMKIKKLVRYSESCIQKEICSGKHLH